jgi:long-subunit acyl-CoA synthetase (AMP-forming)
MISEISNFNNKNESLSWSNNDVHLSYLPLPHVFDRLICSVMIYFGAAIYFYGGDV